MAKQDSSVTAFLGVTAPLYLAPLLFIKNLALPCAVLLVVLFTAFETLPLPVVSLVPWVATALLGRSSSAYENALDISGTELASLTSFLIVYVMVDSTRLWTKLSALLLRWQGVRVGPLFASLMCFAFAASLVLPATFITLLLAAFVGRHMENIKEDIAALHGRIEHHQAQLPLQAPPANKAKVHSNGDRPRARAPPLVGPLSLASGAGSRRASQSVPVPESGPSAALVRIDDIARQLVTAIRSASTDSIGLQLTRSKRRSPPEHFVDVPPFADSAALHEIIISASSSLERRRSITSPPCLPSQHPGLPFATSGADERNSPPLEHGDEADKTATSVGSLWSIRRTKSDQALWGFKSPHSPPAWSRSQSVDSATDRASKKLASHSKSLTAGAPLHANQLVHNIDEVPSGSSSPHDRRSTGARLEAASKTSSSRVEPSADKSRHSRHLYHKGSPSFLITSVSGGAARRASKGSPHRRISPRRTATTPTDPCSPSAPRQSLGGSVVGRSHPVKRRISSPYKGLPFSPRASIPKPLEQPASSPQSPTMGSSMQSRSRSKTDSGQQPSSPTGPVSGPSTLTQATPSGVASPATTGSRLEHTSAFGSYAFEAARSGHDPISGTDSPDLGSHHKSAIMNTNLPPASGRQEYSATETRVESSEALYRRIQKALIVGAAYTSIIAGECGLKGRTRLVINEYYAMQKKTSPLTAVVFVCCLVPASLISIVLFLVFMYNFYLKDIDVAPTPELRIAIHEICKEKWQQEGRLSIREVMFILLFIAISISLVVDTDKYTWVDWTTVSSLCAVVAVGFPQKLGHSMATEHVITWPLVLRHLPWELIVVRLGGSALQVVAEGSMVSSWLLETVLLGNMNTSMHPAWCLVALMTAMALISEVDSGVAAPRLVHKLIHLSERFQLHPLYFVLPVVMQSRCVMLVPYTSTPLVFLHLYAPVQSAELYWLGLLLKVIFCVAFVVAANTMLFV